MINCLIHDHVYRRRTAELSASADKIRFVLLADDGVFRDSQTGEVVTDPKIDIAFGNGDVWFGPQARIFFKTLLSAPKLDWFQSSAAGVDNPGLQKLRAAANRYTTNHTQSESMSEWVLWQALDWLKQGPEHRANAAEGVWKPLDQRDIHGSRWLIVGYGSIGTSVGTRVRALGGHVTGLRRSVSPSEGADVILPLSSLEEEVAKADIVLLSLPHTPSTEDIAGEDFFAAMKPDALFINIGRGKLVDERALITALDAGRPSHAVLDVTREEPLPADHPLWTHPKVTITPHDSPQTHATLLRADETFLANLARYVAGEPLEHELD